MGGSIIDVDNEQDYTLIQVLSYPLDFTGRPQFSKPSQGRFVIKSSEFLDPAVYAKDREITVAGVLEGDIERTVGKKTVRLPLVSSISMYLWPTSWLSVRLRLWRQRLWRMGLQPILWVRLLRRPPILRGDITAPGIGKGSAFQRLSSCEAASVATSPIACIEIAAPCRIMSGGLTVLYLPIAPAGFSADRAARFT